MAANPTHLETIRRCFLFEGAAAASIEKLAERSLVETASRGQRLFDAGDEADGLRLVLGGLVRVWLNDAEGRELTLTLLEEGDAFGEIALLDGMPRSANATAIEETRLLLLRRADLFAVLDDEPALARHVIMLLCERLRRSTGDVGGMAFLDLRRRLGRKLADLALAHARIDGKSARFERRFSQTDLAQMLGATREAVNKQLAAMTRDRQIGVEDGMMIIHDLPALSGTDPDFS